MTRMKRFRIAEDGAVTVDWVVLTAALIGAVVGIFVFLTPAAYQAAAERIRENIVVATDR